MGLCVTLLGTPSPHPIQGALGRGCQQGANIPLPKLHLLRKDLEHGNHRKAVCDSAPRLGLSRCPRGVGLGPARGQTAAAAPPPRLGARSFFFSSCLSSRFIG